MSGRTAWLNKMEESINDECFSRAMKQCGYPTDDQFIATYRLVIGAYLEQTAKQQAHEGVGDEQIIEIDRKFCEAYSAACMSVDSNAALDKMSDSFSDLLRIIRSELPSLKSELAASKRWADTMQTERDYWYNMADSINAMATSTKQDQEER